MPMTEDQRASIRLQVAGLVLGTAPDVLRFDTAKLIERADKVFEWVTAAPAAQVSVSTLGLVKSAGWVPGLGFNGFGEAAKCDPPDVV